MPTYNITLIDLSIIAIYIIFIIGLGLKLSKKHQNAADYFLAGRSMTWFFIGISLFASNISSTTLVGLAGNAYSSGIAVYNYEWMAAVVLVVFAIFLLPFYLRAKIYTVPEFLEKRFDVRSRYYFSILTLFLNILVDTAGSLYAGGLIMTLIFPEIPLWISIGLLALIAGIYTIAGGLAAVIYTDAAQAVLLLIGSVILTILALSQVGGWDAVLAVTPAEHLSLIRPLDDPNMPWLGLVTGVFLLGFYYWATNQAITQRVLTAKNLNHGRWGVLFAGFLKLSILFIMVFPGLIARILYPDLPNQDLAYPTLVFNLLPIGVLGLVLAGLIAAIMSTIDSTLNSASSLVTMDFVHKLRPEMNNKQLMSIGRLVTFIFMLLAVLWAPQIANFNSLFNYLQQILAYAVSPVVAIFILGLFWRRANANGAFIALVSGGIIGLIFFLINVVFEWTTIHFLYVAPILFIISLITAIIISLMSKTPTIETDLIWTKEFYDAETRDLQDLAWYQNYRVLSVLLLSLTAWVVVSYW